MIRYLAGNQRELRFGNENPCIWKYIDASSVIDIAMRRKFPRTVGYPQYGLVDSEFLSVKECPTRRCGGEGDLPVEIRPCSRPCHFSDRITGNQQFYGYFQH